MVQFLESQFPESLDMHVESVGLPLQSASEHNELVEYLLEKRYNSPLPYHAFLQDDQIENKDPIISCIALTHKCKEDENGRLLSHLVFGATRDVKLLRRMVFYPYHISSLQDRNGWLALHYAMYNKASTEITEYMMERNPEHVRVSDIHGISPLHVACQCGCSLEKIKILVNDKQDLLQMRDGRGRLPLHAACEGQTSLDAVEYLVDGNEGNLTVQDDCGELPLHKSCRVGNLSLINYLVERDMRSVSTRNHKNELPVFLLCNRLHKNRDMLESFGYTEIIYKLILAHPETVS